MAVELQAKDLVLAMAAEQATAAALAPATALATATPLVAAAEHSFNSAS